MRKTRMVAVLTAVALSLTVWSGLVFGQPSTPTGDMSPPATTLTVDDSSPVDSPGASSDGLVPTVPDTVTTTEEGLDLEKTVGLVQSLIKLLKGKDWLGASVVIILLLTSFLKTPLMNEFAGRVIPKRFIILIPLGLGVVAGGLQAAIEGGWQNAIATVLTSGTLAVFLHEFIDRVVKGNKKE